MNLLAAEIRESLRTIAAPERAGDMGAYMKVVENNGLGFLGIRRPDVRRVARDSARGSAPELLLDTVVDLWDQAEYREERYAAQDLLGLRWTHGRLDLLALHQRMVLEGAWWDHVDEVAHRIADLVVTHPTTMAATLRAWSTAENFWVRRVAIIGQLGLKDRIDLDLLADVIEPNRDTSEFFLRKAIGWALRDAARTHAGWVRDFVETHELSPLSRREALKHL